MVPREHVKCVPHTTCRMESYCETTKVCRRVPICTPICSDPCVSEPAAPSFLAPAPGMLPPVIEKK
jgi:hypothetical protein